MKYSMIILSLTSLLTGQVMAQIEPVYEGTNGLRETVFVPACLSCHSENLGFSARSGAPSSVNFDTYDNAFRFAGRAVIRGAIQDNMPPNGGLSQIQKNALLAWRDAGFPRSATRTSRFPTLGDGAGTAPDGSFFVTGSSFNGGIAVNGGNPQRDVVQNLADQVDVSGEITVNPIHVGLSADIFVYAVVETSGAGRTVYMLGEGTNIMPWDEQPGSLVAFRKGVVLNDPQTVSMYSGKFVLPGKLNVFFGYRLPDGGLITSSNSINATINQ